MSFEDMPTGVGPVFEGQRIKGDQTYVELGGPKQDMKFELVQVKPAKAIKDGNVEIIGPDIPDITEGSNIPFGMVIEMAGKKLDAELESVLERRIHEFTNYIEGTMHLNQRYDIWERVSKAAVAKGFDSLKYIGTILIRLFKAELPIVEKAQVTMYTDKEALTPVYQEAMEIYKARDEKVAGMSDEGVDTFFGCVLCQSFAPTHCCIVTPERTGLCGAINYFDARASAKVDPKGPNFPITKGTVINENYGEFEGVNATLDKRSLGEVKRISLYSAMEVPHTSCGCFEAIVFAIPEVGGMGIVDRNFKGSAVNGLPFSTMANQTGGGKQVAGFHGVAINYLKSKKFIRADGGWNSIVWIPSKVKERVKEAIPADIIDKIATEIDCTDLDGLMKFIKAKGHPLAAKLAATEEKALAPAEAETGEQGMMPAGGFPVGTIQMALPGAGGGMGIKVILKNCKIHAEKIIIKRMEPAMAAKKK
ncbi:MAG TPA: CO dehydrogenase/CO-methylating acetyl-CoA synthase complex subunit beta [Candidatus Lokiarchaeia archaeon]|nr:CO dehydrogenase/CO-methylating acetyl-CoA synthase complex subunit beta [Candidatus Lokiarchaeia archaeon]